MRNKELSQFIAQRVAQKAKVATTKKLDLGSKETT